jgi:hypothetical protein
MRCAHDTYDGEDKCLQVLVGKPVRKRLLGISEHRWEDNIKWKLHRIEGRGLDLSGSG